MDKKRLKWAGTAVALITIAAVAWWFLGALGLIVLPFAYGLLGQASLAMDRIGVASSGQFDCRHSFQHKPGFAQAQCAKCGVSAS